MRILGQLAVGITILVATLGLLALGPFFTPGGLFVLLWLSPIVNGLANLVWFSVIGAMVIYGVSRSKPGLALAPLVFAMLWAGAAVVSQLRLQASIDAKVWDRPIIQTASAQRTLIVKAFGSIDKKIISDDHISRLIKVHTDNSSGKITDIEEISLTEGNACSAEEKRASPQLQNVGRSEECFKSRRLAEIPDGLVVENTPHIYINRNTGCCSETQARLRSNGKEHLLFSWYQGQGYVLSYFPIFNLTARSTHLWEVGSGIGHLVRYGLNDIDPIQMISAIYGVSPAYHPDYGPPLPRPVLNAAEMLGQAEMFAKQTNASPNSVATLLIGAHDKGLVDEASISTAASLVGHGSESWTAVTNYAKRLTNDQIEMLLEKVLNRLEMPNSCDECVASQQVNNLSLRDWKLRERLSNPEVFQERAIRILVDHHDLATWQYEGCFRILSSLGPQDYPASSYYIEESLLPLVFMDDTLAYSDKAIAFLRANERRTADKQGKLAAKLDLVRDHDLKEYVTRIWGNELVIYEHVRRSQPDIVSPELPAIATKICERIAKVADPILRDQEFGVACANTR